MTPTPAHLARFAERSERVAFECEVNRFLCDMVPEDDEIEF